MRVPTDTRTEPDPQVIADRMREALKGIPQADAASALGISVSTLIRMFNGENSPDYLWVWRAARMSGRSMDWFAGGDEEAA